MEYLSPQARFEQLMNEKIKTLREECHSLRGRLDLVIMAIDHDGPMAQFNNLGVVQGRGLDIDRLCGEIHMLRWICQVMLDEKPIQIDDDELQERFDEIPF